MPSKNEVEIVIIGAGYSRVGLWLLGLVAKVFGISLAVFCLTQRAADGAIAGEIYCHCPSCNATGLPELFLRRR